MPLFREKLEGFSFPSKEKGAKERVVLEKELLHPPRYEKMDEVSVGWKAKSVIIEHFLTRNVPRKPWTKPTVAGEYLLRYQDGTTEAFPVGIGKDVGFYGRRQHQAETHGVYRHNGYSTVYYCRSRNCKGPLGENRSVYVSEILCDFEKELASISYVEKEGVDACLSTCRITVIE